MAKLRWSALSERTRRMILAGAAFEGVLKIAALVDLWRRPSDQVRGPKLAWAVAVALVNSVGALPICYFRFGRKKLSGS